MERGPQQSGLVPNFLFGREGEFVEGLQKARNHSRPGLQVLSLVRKARGIGRNKNVILSPGEFSWALEIYERN
jgi:hypothetical protein